MQFTGSHGLARPGTRRGFLAVALGLLVVLTAPLAANAAVDEPAPGDTNNGGFYVTTTTSPNTSIDVSGFRPVCIRDAPFISYTIVPVGFTPATQSATLVIRATDGTEVGTETVDALTGQILWPGATVDAAGNTTDWPGWRRASDGVSWEPDPTDDLLRDGLTIEVTVDGAPPATATVSYPPDDSACANPPSPDRPSTSTPCVPGDDAAPDECDLAAAGGSPANLVLIGAAALLAGGLMILATRRRQSNLVSGAG